MTQIIYAGPKDSKESRGMVFPRLMPIDVTPEMARDLCSPKPRVFFYVGEKLPGSVIEDRLQLYKREADQYKKHHRDYTILAAGYTDDKDVKKREGAEAEMAWAEERLEEARQNHLQVLQTIHEDEARLEQLGSLRPQPTSPAALQIDVLSREKREAEDRVEKLSNQVDQLTQLVLSLRELLPAVAPVPGPSVEPQADPEKDGKKDDDKKDDDKKKKDK